MYGATTTAPMVYDTSPPQRSPREPLPELPKIRDASPGTIRLQGTLAKRLPPMPAGAMGDLSFSDYRAQEVAAEMYAIKVATAERKAYEQRSRAIAKAKGRAAQRWAEGR